MLTRGTVDHSYTAQDHSRMVSTGYVRVANVSGIVQTWAISRPASYPAPQYNPPAMVSRAGQMSLSLPKQNLMADPTNDQTWQRPYRFS